MSTAVVIDRYQEQYYTSSELARLLKVRPATLINWSRAGQFPQTVRFGPRILRWRKADVLPYLK
jgi:predicted DNA-binding transcriptional regulator AlpA